MKHGNAVLWNKESVHKQKEIDTNTRMNAIAREDRLGDIDKARGHKGIANLIWGALLKLDMGTASTALNEWRNPYAFDRGRPT